MSDGLISQKELNVLNLARYARIKSASKGNEFLCRTAMNLAFMFNKLNVDATPIFERFSGKSRMFRIMKIIQNHKQDLEHLSGKQFRIKSLDEKLEIDDYNFDLYFQKKDQIRFSKTNDQVCAEIGGYLFVFPFPHGLYELIETFLTEYYEFYDLKDCTVVDIGGFVGETAIYFAGKGASRVIVFEPTPPLYRMVQENIRLNRLENVVQTRCEAVSDKCGESNLSYRRDAPSTSSTYFSYYDSEHYRVKTASFASIAQELGHIDLLKMDCEGQEHTIIPRAQKVGALRNIDRVIVETHFEPEHIERFLQKANFRIEKKRIIGEELYLIYAKKTELSNRR